MFASLLCFSLMVRKLYALASGKCAPESPDSPANQEVLLGGHLYLTVLKVHVFALGYPTMYRAHKRLLACCGSVKDYRGYIVNSKQ